MKTILEREMTSLQRERDDLTHEVEGGREERENLRRELQATGAELCRADNEVERYICMQQFKRYFNVYLSISPIIGCQRRWVGCS